MAKKTDDTLEMGMNDDEANALSETTGESTQDPEGADKVKKGSKNMIKISSIDIPTLKDKQPGDTVEAMVTFKVGRVDPKNDSFEVEPIDFIPKEMIMGDQSQAQPPQMGGQQGGQPGGGGLGKLMG